MSATFFPTVGHSGNEFPLQQVEAFFLNERDTQLQNRLYTGDAGYYSTLGI